MTDVMDAVATAATDVSRLYAVNSVPAAPTYPYGSYSASLGRGGAYLNDAREGIRWGRITVQTFGKTAASALAKAEAVRSELVGTVLEFDGYSATPCRSELDPAIVRDPDTTGVVAVTTTLTFTATKEA